MRLLSLSRSTLGGRGFRLALGGLKCGHDFRLAWPWVSDWVSSCGFPVAMGLWGCGWPWVLLAVAVVSLGFDGFCSPLYLRPSSLINED